MSWSATAIGTPDEAAKEIIGVIEAMTTGANSEAQDKVDAVTTAIRTLVGEMSHDATQVQVSSSGHLGESKRGSFSSFSLSVEGREWNGHASAEASKSAGGAAPSATPTPAPVVTPEHAPAPQEGAVAAPPSFPGENVNTEPENAQGDVVKTPATAGVGGSASQPDNTAGTGAKDGSTTAGGTAPQSAQ